MICEPHFNFVLEEDLPASGVFVNPLTLEPGPALAKNSLSSNQNTRRKQRREKPYKHQLNPNDAHSPAESQSISKALYNKNLRDGKKQKLKCLEKEVEELKARKKELEEQVDELKAYIRQLPEKLRSSNSNAAIDFA